MRITPADFGKSLSDIPGLNPDDLPVGTFVGPVEENDSGWSPLIKWVDNLWYTPKGFGCKKPPVAHYKLLSVPTTSVGYPVNCLRDNIKMVRGMLGVPESTSTPDDSIQDAKELESILAHLLSLTRSRLIEAEKVRDTAVQQSITRDLEPLRKRVARLCDLAGVRGEVFMSSRESLENSMDLVIGMLEVQARARDSQPPAPAPDTTDVETLKGFVNRVRRALGGSETEYNTKEELMRALDAGLRGVETRGVQSKTKGPSPLVPAPVPSPPVPAPTLADVPMDTLIQEVAKRMKASAPFVDHTFVKMALGLW